MLDNASACPTAAALAPLAPKIEPDDLGGSAPDVEHHDVVRAGLDEGRAAGYGEARLRLARQDFDVQAKLASSREPGTRPVFRNAAGFRGHQPMTPHVVALELAAQTPKRRWCVDRGLGQAAGAPMPSPRRMMRENASTTRKPRREGRASKSGNYWCPDPGRHKQRRGCANRDPAKSWSGSPGPASKVRDHQTDPQGHRARRPRIFPSTWLRGGRSHRATAARSSGVFLAQLGNTVESSPRRVKPGPMD